MPLSSAISPNEQSLKRFWKHFPRRVEQKRLGVVYVEHFLGAECEATKCEAFSMNSRQKEVSKALDPASRRKRMTMPNIAY
jgi:hypothetical protein